MHIVKGGRGCARVLELWMAARYTHICIAYCHIFHTRLNPSLSWARYRHVTHIDTISLSHNHTIIQSRTLSYHIPCTYTHIHAHTRTYTYTYTHIYIHIHTHTYAFIRIHTYTFVHIHTHSYTDIHTHSYTYIHIHTRTYIHNHIQTP